MGVGAASLWSIGCHFYSFRFLFFICEEVYDSHSHIVASVIIVLLLLGVRCCLLFTLDAIVWKEQFLRFLLSLER